MRTVALSEREKTVVSLKSQTREGVTHHTTVDNETGEAFCEGYCCHGHCWHVTELGNAV